MVQEWFTTNKLKRVDKTCYIVYLALIQQIFHIVIDLQIITFLEDDTVMGKYRGSHGNYSRTGKISR